MTEPDSCGNCGAPTDNEPMALCDERQKDGMENDAIRERLVRLTALLRDARWAAARHTWVEDDIDARINAALAEGSK